MMNTNTTKPMAVILGKSVGLLVGIWDAETQSWFGCRTDDPMGERRAPTPRYEQALERAPKGGWRSVQIPLVEDEPIEQTVHYILHLQSEHPELCLGVVESGTGEMVRVLSSRMLDDERAAYVPEALEKDPRRASSAEVERYRKDRATSHPTRDLPWQEPWARSIGGDTLLHLPKVAGPQRADALEFPQCVECFGDFITTKREYTYIENETTDEGVYIAKYYPPLVELVLERRCCIDISAGPKRAPVRITVEGPNNEH